MKKFFNTLLVFLTVFSGLAQEKDDSYNFPIRPGTEEWISLDSYEARLNAYNIPEDILRNMSTLGLVETCLIYPE